MERAPRAGRAALVAGALVAGAMLLIGSVQAQPAPAAEATRVPVVVESPPDAGAADAAAKPNAGAPGAGGSGGGESGAPPVPGAGPVEVKPEPAAPPVDVNTDRPPPSTYDKQRGADGGDPAVDDAPSLMSQLVRTILALLLVVALIYGAGKIAMARLGRLSGGPGKVLKVVERVALDNRHALYLVEVEDGPSLVVGSGEKGVALVASLDLPRRTKSEETGRSFSQVLSRAAGSSAQSSSAPNTDEAEQQDKST